MKNKFVVFILSHNRPNNVITLKTLFSQGYTGDWYIIIDDEEPQKEEYLLKFKNHVLIFNKDSISNDFDLMDNFENKNVTVYTRNVCFKFAEELHYDYFLELDDDYLEFEFREENNNKLLTHHITDLDNIFDSMIEFLEDTKACSVAFAQGGDMIGGCHGGVWKNKIKRKVMNSFFCKTSNKFTFDGRLNEDVTAYAYLGSLGKLFLTISFIDLRQKPTQQNNGGMTDIYLESGTYVKSFYSIIKMPSCIKLDTMGETHKRIHHKILWDNCVPKIISDKFKK